MATARFDSCAGHGRLAWVGALVPIAAFLVLGAVVTAFPEAASDVQLCCIQLAAALVGLVLSIQGVATAGRAGWRSSVFAGASALLINGYVATGTAVALLDLLKRR